MIFAGTVTAILMASNCNEESGCVEIAVAPFHGPAGFSLCQSSAKHFNATGIFEVVSKSTQPVVFVCKPPTVGKQPAQNM